jgi:hypothetical protein
MYHSQQKSSVITLALSREEAAAHYRDMKDGQGDEFGDQINNA